MKTKQANLILESIIKKGKAKSKISFYLFEKNNGVNLFIILDNLISTNLIHFYNRN